MRTKKIWTLILAGLLAFGCDNGGGGEDAGTGTDSGPGTDSGMMMRTDSGMMMTGDGNDSFADADDITVGGDPAMGSILAGDRDYYTFDGTEGDWIIISTAANPDDDPMMVDTVVTLYGSTMNQIAENDDAQPRVNTDSEIITRLPATGTYYVMVQEFSQWNGDTPEGMSSFTYALTVAGLNTDAALVNLDAEGGDDVASAQALGFNTEGTFNLIVGDFDDATDVDVFSFSTTAGNEGVQFSYMVSGTDGNGSTTTPARLWVTDSTGATVIARIDSTMLDEIQPNLPTGDYLLFVEHGTAGANDFYVLKTFRGNDNPLETEPNNDAATAQALTLEAVPDTMIRRAFVLANLDADDDFFSITTTAGEAVNVFCESRTSGSGVVDLTATVLTSAGAALPTPATATETATATIAIEDAAVPSAGTYVVRLSKASQDSMVTGNWVRCGIAVGPPTP